MHIDDAGQRLDRSPHLRVDLEAARDGNFDLARRKVEHYRNPAAAARLAGDDTLEARERTHFAKKHPQAGRGIGDDRIERLDSLHNQALALLATADIDGDDQRLTRIEQSPRLA